MAGTRSSTRLSSQPKSSPTQPMESPKAAVGSKRKAENGTSPSAKRGRKSTAKKEQKTIEDTMDIEPSGDAPSKADGPGDTSEPDPEAQIQDAEQPEDAEPEEQAEKENSSEPAESKQNEEGNRKQTDQQQSMNSGSTETKSEDHTTQQTSKMDDSGKIEPEVDSRPQSKRGNETATNGDNAVETHARDDDTPSSILEKGVIYFLIRGRIGIDSPSEVDDIARSYMILRPIPHGAKIGEGPIGDGNGKCRLLALPKKVLPISGKDKFMIFVEKSKTTFKELKDEFMSASDYETKTAGVRHTPAVTPVAEGVYAITTTGRESHLAYMITIPQELGQVQKDIGIHEQGSFITSTKNPQYAGPANTNLPQGPDYPKEILDEFRSLRWAPLQPKYLDYENAQFLLIGESDGLDKATEQQPGDKDDNKMDPKEELEKLEDEDQIRIKHMKGDDAVFADLGISKKDYPQVPTTWND